MINEKVIKLVDSLEVLCTSDLSPLSISILETLRNSLEFNELNDTQKRNVDKVLDEYRLYLSQIYSHINYSKDDVIDYFE
ncbi:MAG: hypothetical protein ACRCXT_12210 [Paraclostridium sp.]